MNKIKYFWNGKARGLCGAVVLVLGASINKIGDKLSTKLVKNNLKFCGSNVTINRGFTYRYPKNIEVGNNVRIARNVEFFSENPEGSLIVEDGSVITFDVRLDFSGDLIIGRNTLISKKAIIETHDHGLDPFSEPVFKKLVIGENVWIGMNAIILSSVGKIGANSIVAAGSIVTKEIPENVIVGGIPAKIIKYR